MSWFKSALNLGGQWLPEEKSCNPKRQGLHIGSCALLPKLAGMPHLIVSSSMQIQKELHREV